MSLHRIIRQMNEPRLQITQVEGLGASAEVAVSVHVAFQDTVYGCQHSIGSYIKFPTRNQEWFLNVLLDYGGP